MIKSGLKPNICFVFLVFLSSLSLSIVDCQQIPPVDGPGSSSPPVDPSLPRTYSNARGYKPPPNPNVISIGAVLESQEAIAQFLQVIEEVTLEPNINAPGVTLYAVSIPLNQNPVRTAQAVCEKLIKSQVSFDSNKIVVDEDITEKYKLLRENEKNTKYNDLITDDDDL